MLWGEGEISLIPFKENNKIQSSKVVRFWFFCGGGGFGLGFVVLFFFFFVNLNPKGHMSLSLVSEINHFLPKCSLVQSWLASVASENRPVLTNYCCYISFSTSLKTEPVKTVI